jgi:hypothetical protein
MDDPGNLGIEVPVAPASTTEDDAPESPRMCTAADVKGKGRAEEPVEEPTAPTLECHLTRLPAELIDCILLYLSVVDLVSVSATCHALYTIATSEHIWHTHVQENVPGVRITSPYPLKSYRALYGAHDPRWFLPKYKIWFSDMPGLIGRLVVVRYDQRRGCIEGYQLLSRNDDVSEQVWEADPTVRIQNFEPRHKLHLDRPILHLAASLPGKLSQEEQQVGSIKVINLRWTDEDDPLSRLEKRRGTRFRSGVPMELGANDATRSHFMHAQALSHEDADRIVASHFPYSGLWPPPTVPAPHRVTGANPYGEGEWPRFDDDPPRHRKEISDRCFRIRTFFNGPETSLTLMNFIARTIEDPIPLHFGGQLATYATLDPHLYTPTAEKPYRGIWVGDYSVHGCEYVFLHQPDDDPGDHFDPESLVREDGESDEAFAQRKVNATVYRGRLEAIKLTGDPHVPRGELTFSVDDLGEAGFLGVLEDPPFTGARVVRSRGHVAGQGFIEDDFLSSRLFLISHDCIAQYWERFRHISFFKRVDIDQFLDPT